MGQIDPGANTSSEGIALVGSLVESGYGCVGRRQMQAYEPCCWRENPKRSIQEYYLGWFVSGSTQSKGGSRGKRGQAAVDLETDEDACPNWVSVGRMDQG
jgi:hypothetical protein